MDFKKITRYSMIYAFVIFFGILNVVLVFVWTKEYLGGFAWQEDPLHEFNYHPVLAVLGLVVLYGKGLLIYRTLSSSQKATLKLLHTTIFLLVFVFSVVSLKSVFDSHDYRMNPIPNLYSLHSWIGLGTVILFAIQFICGFAAFLFPRVRAAYRRSYMPLHQFFGITIFALSVISCHTGIMEKVKSSLGKKYQMLPSSAYIANFLGITITVFAILVVYLAAMPSFKRRPLEEEDKLQLELKDSMTQLS